MELYQLYINEGRVFVVFSWISVSIMLPSMIILIVCRYLINLTWLKLALLIHIFIYQFIPSSILIDSSIRPFALSPNRAFFHSSINQHIRMSVRPFFVLTIVHPFIHSFIYCVFIRLFLHLSFRPYSSIHSVLYLFTSLLHWKSVYKEKFAQLPIQFLVPKQFLIVILMIFYQSSVYSFFSLWYISSSAEIQTNKIDSYSIKIYWRPSYWELLPTSSIIILISLWQTLCK